jgi:hypothetical protein
MFRPFSESTEPLTSFIMHYRDLEHYDVLSHIFHVLHHASWDALNAILIVENDVNLKNRWWLFGSGFK